METEANIIELPAQQQPAIPRFKSVVDTLNEFWVECDIQARNPAMADRKAIFERQMADLVMARDAVRRIYCLQREFKKLDLLKEDTPQSRQKASSQLP